MKQFRNIKIQKKTCHVWFEKHLKLPWKFKLTINVTISSGISFPPSKVYVLLLVSTFWRYGKPGVKQINDLENSKWAFIKLDNLPTVNVRLVSEN